MRCIRENEYRISRGTFTYEESKMHKKKHRYNWTSLVLCGLVFFVIAGTAFCMVAESKESAAVKAKAEAAQKAAEEEERAAKAAEKVREEALSVKPGVPAGTLELNKDEKIVYLTFDDGPSKNTEHILDILEKYDAEATFFITGANAEQLPLIKKAYDAGHTIGLHTYSHDYADVYSSEEAYFNDLEKVGKIAEEQIGFVPCFIRFPGGSSNNVSAKYSPGIMSKLAAKVQEKGFQYYDWNVDSGDGAGADSEEIKKRSVTDRYSHVMILFHDSQTKTETVKALPAVMDYYKALGYEFCAIDRDSFVSHHAVLN